MGIHSKYPNVDNKLIISDHYLQTDEVLSKDSANEITDGKTPGPMTEIRFWEAKCVNLESLFEQMKSSTTEKMASILYQTDSAYYPCFK